jgi:small subunit ribosomal protein S16
MLKIRLQRVGKKHEPVFRLVLTDSKNSTKSGKFLEILGSYDPRQKNETQLKADEIKEWISKGAKPTDTVHNLLINNKVIEGKKINVLPKKSPIVKELTEDSNPATQDGQEEKTAEEAKNAPSEEGAETPAEDKPAEEVKEEVKEVVEEKKDPSTDSEDSTSSSQASSGQEEALVEEAKEEK